MWSYLSAYFDIHYTFQVGSYSYDMARMVFEIATLGYIQRNQSIVMDYEIEIRWKKNSLSLIKALFISTLGLTFVL